MTTKELITLLAKYPGETQIWYRDMNFGGKEDEFIESNIELEEGVLLIESRYFPDLK